VYRLNGGPEQSVFKVDGGLQGALLVGSGTSRVTFHYRPTGLRNAATISLVAIAAITIVLGAAAWTWVSKNKLR
jgi:hypothetical protein